MAVYNERIPVFTFVAGLDPKVGQSWEINREVDVDGIKIDIHDVKVVEEPTDQGRDDSLGKGYAITDTKSSTINISGDFLCEDQRESMQIMEQAAPANLTHSSIIIPAAYLTVQSPAVFSMLTFCFQKAERLNGSPCWWKKIMITMLCIR